MERERQTPGSGSDYAGRFVGRAAELAWLNERVRAARAGSGGVVFVTGERGVGKTALVGELMRQLRGAEALTLVSGRCVEHEGPGEAFLPFLDAAGRMLLSRGRLQTLELLRGCAPTVCVQFPSGLVPDPDGRLRREALGASKERLIREAGDFMEAASRQFPVVMWLEDLQWADAPSVELLGHVARRAARQRVLILGTFRDAELAVGNAPLRRCALELFAQGLGRELALGPLAQVDVAAWLDARFTPNRFPADLAQAIYARAEGLPLFVRGLVELLLEQGAIASAGGTWELTRPLPELDLQPSRGLKELVRQRLDALPERELELLRLASVVGLEFAAPVVADLASGDALVTEERLARLDRGHRLLEPRGEEELPDGTLATRYRFAHGLYQAVLYEDLLPRRRTQLHLQAAESLRRHWGEQAARVAVEIAHHLERGRDFAAAAAFRAEAGDVAASRWAYLEASEHYGWALRLLERPPADATRAQALTLHMKRGAVEHARGAFEDAVREFEAALALARAERLTGAECDALLGLSVAFFFAQRIDEMALAAHAALAAAARSGSASRQRSARVAVAQVLVCEGRLREAVPLLDAVMGEAREAGPPGTLLAALTFRALVHYCQSEYRPAEACFDEALQLATVRGDGFQALAAWVFRGLSRANLGRLSQALADLEAATAMAERNGDGFWRARLLSHQGWLYRELNDLERAHALDSASLRVAREQSVAWAPEADALINLSLDHAQAGHEYEALALLGELQGASLETRWFRWFHELRLEAAAAGHWLVRGDTRAAAERATRLLTLAQRLGARSYACSAERILAEHALAAGAELAGPARALAATLAALAEHPAPFEEWRSARVLAALHERLGAAAEARRCREHATRVLRAMADGVSDETLRARFLAAPRVAEALGVTPEPVAGPAAEGGR
jgi:hypothetical protein